MAIIIMGLAVFLLAGQVMAVEDTVSQARIAFSEEDYDRAEELWLEVLDKEIYEWEANFYLGLTYMRQDEMKQAEEYMSEAYEISPEDHSTLINYARILYNRDKLDEALEVLRQVPADLRAEDGRYFNVRGLIAMAQDDMRMAIRSLDTAVEREPDNYFIRNNLGLAHIREGNYEDAVKHLEEAVDMEPRQAYIYNNLGVSYENLNELERAKESYEKALEINPDHPHAGTNLERVLSRLED